MTEPVLNVVRAMGVQNGALTSDVPENDYPLWVFDATYAIGARVTQEYEDAGAGTVTVVNTHKIWESVQAANVGKSPKDEPTWWKEVSPTNRWKMFDLSTGSQTLITAPRYYQISLFRPISSVAFANTKSIASIRVRLTAVNTGVVDFDQTFSLRGAPLAASWWAWTDEERMHKTGLVVNDLPRIALAILRIDIVPIGSDGGIGACLFGRQKSIGTGVHAGAGFGVSDYSRKKKNEYGDVELQQLGYSDTSKYTMDIDNDLLDHTKLWLADLRATPCMWSIRGSFDSSIVYGTYASFDIVVRYAHFAVCNIDIEGFA